jgi:cysteine synthase B
MGTSGTFMGISRRLASLIPRSVLQRSTRCPLHGLEGMKHMPTALVPGIYDQSLADENLRSRPKMRTRWSCAWRAKKASVGVSSAPTMVAALQVASRLKSGVVVTIFCDSAAKYLSESFWTDPQSEAENWP